MNAKAIAILSDVTLMGWIVDGLQNKGSAEKRKRSRYHLEQGLGLFFFPLVPNSGLTIVATGVPAFIYSCQRGDELTERPCELTG